MNAATLMTDTACTAMMSESYVGITHVYLTNNAILYNNY